MPAEVIPPGSGTVLEVRDLHVSFSTPDGVVQAVRGVDFSVSAGEVLGLVGESGSGKSVTMLATMGLLPRSATLTGSVRYRGTELVGRPEAELRRLRGNDVAMVFQDPMTALNPVLTVGFQIAEAVEVHHPGMKRSGALSRATELLDLVGIPNATRRARAYPHEFSGGMRQRAMIAMAIANDPDVLIADEPTTALDVTIQAQILELLRQIQQDTGLAIVLITHDLGLVAGMADRVMVMYAGEVVELGGVFDIFARPRHPYTIGLLGSLPRLDETGEERLIPIAGAPPSLVHLPPGCAFHPRCGCARETCREASPALRPLGKTGQCRCHFAEELTPVAAP